jgi:hypothetical protein
MKTWDRIKHLWAPGPAPDHPLSDEERHDARPHTASEESAQFAGELLGRPDPDDRGAIDHESRFRD